MNRILFESAEIVNGRATFGGARAEHVRQVLHGEVGQILKTGEVDGPLGTGEIVALDGDRVTVRVHHAEKSPEPWIDLILAPPRPRVMKRLLPQLAALGVGRLVLVGAQKVERDFWGATLLREENYRPLLIDGLMQAGTTPLPKIACWKSFARFLREGLASFPTTDRLVAHPYVPAARTPPPAPGPGAPRPLLAVGPEGGWTDEEVAKLAESGFRGYSLGPRILRTDTATIALLAQLMEKYENLG